MKKYLVLKPIALWFKTEAQFEYRHKIHPGKTLELNDDTIMYETLQSIDKPRILEILLKEQCIKELKGE